jgi:hypothetical protein
MVRCLAVYYVIFLSQQLLVSGALMILKSKTPIGDCVRLRHGSDALFVAKRVEGPCVWRMYDATCSQDIEIPKSQAVKVASSAGALPLWCCKKCQTLHHRRALKTKRADFARDLADGPRSKIDSLVVQNRKISAVQLGALSPKLRNDMLEMLLADQRVVRLSTTSMAGETGESCGDSGDDGDSLSTSTSSSEDAKGDCISDDKSDKMDEDTREEPLGDLGPTNASVSALSIPEFRQFYEDKRALFDQLKKGGVDIKQAQCSNLTRLAETLRQGKIFNMARLALDANRRAAIDEFEKKSEAARNKKKLSSLHPPVSVLPDDHVAALVKIRAEVLAQDKKKFEDSVKKDPRLAVEEARKARQDSVQKYRQHEAAKNSGKGGGGKVHEAAEKQAESAPPLVFGETSQSQDGVRFATRSHENYVPVPALYEDVDKVDIFDVLDSMKDLIAMISLLITKEKLPEQRKGVQPIPLESLIVFRDIASRYHQVLRGVRANCPLHEITARRCSQLRLKCTAGGYKCFRKWYDVDFY